MPVREGYIQYSNDLLRENANGGCDFTVIAAQCFDGGFFQERVDTD